MSKFCDENKKIIDLISEITGRHPRQTEQIMNMLDDNFEKYLLLEEKISNNFIFYSPGDIETIEEILNIKKDKSSHFSLGTFKNMQIIK